MFKFSLVGVLTARGFHVKGHSLISENMSPRVPCNSLFSFTAVCRRLSRRRLRHYAPSPPLKRSAQLALLHFFCFFVENLSFTRRIFFILIKESTCTGIETFYRRCPDDTG